MDFGTGSFLEEDETHTLPSQHSSLRSGKHTSIQIFEFDPVFQKKSSAKTFSLFDKVLLETVFENRVQSHYSLRVEI
jgi:hypothetical protein